MLAMAAGIATIACAGVYFGIQVAHVTQGPTLTGNGANGGATPGAVASSGGPDATPGKASEVASNPTPRIEIAKASSDVETWLAVGEEMDALMRTTAADLSATASALEEKAMASFAADDWYSESSL